MIRRLLQFAFGLMLAVMTFTSAFADDIQINTARIEYADQTYRLRSSYAFNLNHTLQEALVHGVALYFKTEVEVSQPRAFWFDDVPVWASKTTRISYNVLTRRYSVSIPGTLQRSYSRLDDAIAAVKYPPSWAIASASALESGVRYQVLVRMTLDISQLPKPFQINAINNNDWKLASEWTYFSYTP